MFTQKDYVTGLFQAEKEKLIEKYLHDIFGLDSHPGWKIVMKMDDGKLNAVHFVKETVTACILYFGFNNDVSFYQNVRTGGKIDYTNIEPIAVAGTVAQKLINLDFANPESFYREHLEKLVHLKIFG